MAVKRIGGSIKRRIGYTFWRQLKNHKVPPAHPVNYTKFIILGQGRSGSNYLRTLLESHPHIKIFSELFNPKIDTRRHGSGEVGPITLNDDPIEYLEHRIYQEYPDHIKAVGFKFFYFHAKNKDWQKVWSYLRNPQVRVIHLKRRNLLDRYLSLQLAKRSDIWQAHQTEQNITYNQPLEMDPKKCFRHFRWSLHLQKEASLFFQTNPQIEIFYEDLVKNPTAEIKRVLDFLNLGFYDLNTTCIKQRTKRKPDLIANYTQFKKQFSQNLRVQLFHPEWLNFFDDEEESDL